MQAGSETEQIANGSAGPGLISIARIKPTLYLVINTHKSGSCLEPIQRTARFVVSTNSDNRVDNMGYESY